MKAKTEDLDTNTFDSSNFHRMQTVTQVHPHVENCDQKDLKAINGNTFVVKLNSAEKKSTELDDNITMPDANEELSPIPNLLQFVQGNNKHKFQLIKSIGTRKFLLNNKPKKQTLKVHAKPAPSNQITIITPNKLHSPIIRKFSNLPQNISNKSVAQSLLSINKLPSDEKENHTSPNSFKINKNMMFSTGTHTLGSNSKFTFNLETFSIKREFLNGDFNSKSTPIHVSIPNLKPPSPLKSIDENLTSEIPDIDKEYLKDDGDLTNLSWLCNGNDLIKDLPLSSTDEFGLFSDDDDLEKNIKQEIMSPNSGIFTATSKVTGSATKYPTKCEPNTAFNPNGKPPYSFSCLIFMAIEDSIAKKLPVKAIYHWVCKHFPYFHTAAPGWKNSIRHNLSLNKCFKKADVEQHTKDPTKGSLWCIDPAYRPNLIQALKRTPFYPYIHPSGIGQPLSLSNLANLLPGAQSGRIPLWSPNLTTKTSISDPDPDVASAALNLLNLKSKEDNITTNKNIRNTIKELQKEILERKGFWPCPWNSLSRTDSLSSLESSDDGIIVSRDSNDDHNYTQPFKYLVETHDSETPLSPESEKSAPDAAYEFETGGTDEEEFYDEIDHDEIVSTDSDDDLTDSGFSGKRKYEIKQNFSGKKRKAQERLSSTPPKKSPKVSTEKQDKTPKKMKIKMGPKVNKKTESRSSNKRKYNAKMKPDSDVDSGKDSPKIVRSRSCKRKIQNDGNEYKKLYNTSFMRQREGGNYSTRSSTITRSSNRLSGKRPTAPKKKTRRRSSAPTNDDEEIQLAAGSLMHLAGFKSPPTAVS